MNITEQELPKLFGEGFEEMFSGTPRQTFVDKCSQLAASVKAFQNEMRVFQRFEDVDLRKFYLPTRGVPVVGSLREW